MPHGAIGRACRRLAVVAAALCCAGASAQALTGVAGGPLPNGGVVSVTFNCSGTPTCTGSYVALEQRAGCSNLLGRGGGMTLNGLNISAIGVVQGTGTFQNISVDATQQADGTCTITAGSQHDESFSYQGAWDGTEGGALLTGTDDQGRPVQLGMYFSSGTTTLPTIPAPPSPPFQMTTSVNVTATTANATAQITYPAADVGKTESVFVFALAPRSLVKSLRASPLDGTDTCVLAQLDPSGHLVQTSASQMQPYVTGVLQAQGQAVTVLNNASTPNVAGASFFVGYGSDGASMVSTGVNRNVTTIPGATQCPAIVPANAGPLSGLWWNPGESGWGIDFVQRRNILFAAWFTYDAAGNPKWYVASDCEMPDPMASSGTCNGKLYEVTAGPFLGVAFDPTKVHVNEVGTLQVSFTDASNATMTYTVNGVSRTVGIVRQLFASGSAPPAIDFTDLWWASPANSESGWGMAISHQFGVMFLAWFVYDASGKPVWYVASDCVVSGNGCSGDLFTVTGPPFGPTFNTNLVHATSVGHITVTFTGPNDGSLSYTIGTTTATKLITRQIF